MHSGITDHIIDLLLLLIAAAALDSMVRFLVKQVRGFKAEFKRGLHGYPSDQKH